MAFDDKFFIAYKIKQYRKKRSLTQERLAESVGISSKQLSRIENGDYIPSLPTFLKIVSTLKIDISEFGINLPNDTSPIKTKLLKLIYSLTDEEAEFYYNIVKSISDNIEIFQKKDSLK